VERTHYPGLPGAPGHALARAQMSEFGAVVSFDVRAGAQSAGRVAEALQLFAMAASLGATDSLVLPPQLLASRDLNDEQQRQAGMAAGTVRLSIGLEDVDDLIEDLRAALAAAHQP
jgi:cystathionine gamma-synthase